MPNERCGTIMPFYPTLTTRLASHPRLPRSSSDDTMKLQTMGPGPQRRRRKDYSSQAALQTKQGVSHPRQQRSYLIKSLRAMATRTETLSIDMAGLLFLSLSSIPSPRSSLPLLRLIFHHTQIRAPSPPHRLLQIYRHRPQPHSQTHKKPSPITPF